MQELDFHTKLLSFHQRHFLLCPLLVHFRAEYLFFETFLLFLRGHGRQYIGKLAVCAQTSSVSEATEWRLHVMINKVGNTMVWKA